MNGQKALKPIALIKTGGTIEQIKSQYGDFEDWFSKGLGAPDLMQVDVYKNHPLPPAENLSGIVITGSAAMVSEKEDWSERTANWLAKAVNNGTPVLGICYGHQLLAHALGGVAGPNPAGRQIGTVTTKLMDSAAEDPLLKHLPKSFESQTSHSEVVLELPPGAERLATSPLDDNFSIRFADMVWGMQFHPEFSGAIMSNYINYRADAIRQEGLDPEALLERVADTDQASSVLQRFTDLLTK
jgi:GMP synthase (glutamine-hydrolysing)